MIIIIIIYQRPGKIYSKNIIIPEKYNIPETRKYWVDVQRVIVSSHGERSPL